MDKKKVDICICVKNREGLIDKTIDQLMRQTMKDFNILLCDDLSIDHTMDKMLEYQDKYPGIVYAWQTDKEGYINVHNFILSKTVSDYVCVIDVDDLIDKVKIEVQYKYLESHPEIDVLSSSTMFPEQKVLPNTLIELEHYDIEDYLKNGYSMTTICFFESCMFRRKCLESFSKGIYFYDEFVGGRAGEGFLYTLFFNGYKFANINTTTYLYTYKILPDSLSNIMIPVYAEHLDKLTYKGKKAKILNLFKKYNPIN